MAWWLESKGSVLIKSCIAVLGTTLHPFIFANHDHGLVAYSLPATPFEFNSCWTTRLNGTALKRIVGWQLSSQISSYKYPLCRAGKALSPSLSLFVSYFSQVSHVVFQSFQPFLIHHYSCRPQHRPSSPQCTSAHDELN